MNLDGTHKVEKLTEHLQCALDVHVKGMLQRQPAGFLQAAGERSSVIQSAPCHVTANIIVTQKTMCVFKPNELGHAKTNLCFK